MKRAVLDHGFVILRNISGPTRRADCPRCIDEPMTGEYDADDIDPANSARMSFDNMDSGRPRDQDLGLCDYLMRNRHSTPFEMVQIWIEMKLPIFVARQFVRHRTVTINEVSARYVQLPAEWYVPDPHIVGIKPANIKQGRVIRPDDQPQGEIADFCHDLDAACRSGYAKYDAAIKSGIPPELARCFLHLNHYTHWLWSQDLHNMMHFLSLRAHDHAQYEAQQYAYAIIELLDQVLPHSMALFRKYRQQS